MRRRRRRRRRRGPRPGEPGATAAANAAASGDAGGAPDASGAPAAAQAPNREPRHRGPHHGRPRHDRPREDRPGADRREEEQRRDRGFRGGEGRDRGPRGKDGRRDRGPKDWSRGRGRNDFARKPPPKLYSFESVVDRGFEDVPDPANEGATKRVDWTIVKRTVADQRSGRPVSAIYLLKREGTDTEFTQLAAARAAVHKTIVHPEKLTKPKAEYVSSKK